MIVEQTTFTSVDIKNMIVSRHTDEDASFWNQVHRLKKLKAVLFFINLAGSIVLCICIAAHHTQKGKHILIHTMNGLHLISIILLGVGLKYPRIWQLGLYWLLISGMLAIALGFSDYDEHLLAMFMLYYALLVTPFLINLIAPIVIMISVSVGLITLLEVYNRPVCHYDIHLLLLLILCVSVVATIFGQILLRVFMKYKGQVETSNDILYQILARVPFGIIVTQKGRIKYKNTFSDKIFGLLLSKEAIEEKLNVWEKLLEKSAIIDSYGDTKLEIGYFLVLNYNIFTFKDITEISHIEKAKSESLYKEKMLSLIHI